MNKFYIAIIIIIVILLINIYVSISLLNGVWQFTEEFGELTGVNLIMYIDGFICKDVRIVITHGEETLVYDGNMYFANYNPLSLMLLPAGGYVKCTKKMGEFPELMKFYFDPRHPTLTFGDTKKCYGDFVKIVV